jgi:hypothetical protein
VGFAAAQPKIIGDSLMPSGGFTELEHHGGIYHLAMGIGKTRTGVFADGGMRASGKKFIWNSRKRLILSDL